MGGTVKPRAAGTGGNHGKRLASSEEMGHDDAPGRAERSLLCSGRAVVSTCTARPLTEGSEEVWGEVVTRRAALAAWRARAAKQVGVSNDNLFRLAPELMAAIPRILSPSEDESKSNQAFVGFLDSVSVLTKPVAARKTAAPFVPGRHSAVHLAI